MRRVRIVRAAVMAGLLPPATVFGVRSGTDAQWDLGPLVVGSALWIVIAMAFAAVAIARLEHRSAP